LPDHQFQGLVQVCGLRHLGLTDVVGEQLRGFLLARNMVDRGGFGEACLRVAGVGDDVTIGQQYRLDLGGQPFDSGVVEHFQGDVGGVDGGVGVVGGVVLVPHAGQVRAGV